MTNEQKYQNANEHLTVPEDLKARTLAQMKQLENAGADAPVQPASAPRGKVISLARHYRSLAACVAVALIGAFALGRVLPHSGAQEITVTTPLLAGETEQEVALSDGTLFFNDQSGMLDLSPNLGTQSGGVTLSPLHSTLADLPQLSGLTGTTVSGTEVFLTYQNSGGSTVYRAYFMKHNQTYLLTGTDLSQQEFISSLLSVLQ